jgi:hypothetical protein
VTIADSSRFDFSRNSYLQHIQPPENPEYGRYPLHVQLVEL